ncbi:lysine transporter LysE [Sphingopyxis sp. Root214]|jgi:threonine/homoserine/homoserine lactone efflux protein|uniref:LysE family translocator n=1 Tax=unclassified Sphingopyxis TaxID=2614943 RepID=UPI0006F4D507|nr:MULTISPECIES: LysE family translocator [unclassified Sphingopyxis]KQZ77042.1 lysine transporter LysE [Sphingopyxis sp. Root154]KRC09072.1 lysine transporter LysE [Sphingopyxis sp. Root214]
MLDLTLLLAFLGAACVLTVTPGVDTAMVLRAATIDGRHSAVFASIGIALGCLIWGAAVSLGLGTILRASDWAYTILKSAGAAYLLWLGAKLLLEPRDELDASTLQPVSIGLRGAFSRGFLTNLLNPKIGVFYVTFLPQFVPVGANIAGYSFFLAVLHVALTLVWFTALITATVPLGKVLRSPKAIKTLDRLTGLVLVTFGLKLAASSAR